MPKSPFPGDAPTGLTPRLRGSMRAVLDHPFGGTLLMTGFPGLETGFDGTAVFTPDHCRETLDGLKAFGARSLVVLVERDELDPVGFEVLEATAADLGLAVIYHPIVDYGVPSEALTRTWLEERDARKAHLSAGGTLAFSCQYGAGRSGLMTCWTLMEAGLSASEAMAKVRAAFPEAVESAEQEAWLQALTE